jgi:guanylate kinase
VKFADYTANPAVLKQLTSVDFVAVVGPTAVGKTTIINALLARDPSLPMLLVTTSREARPYERDDIDYHFRSETDMERRIKAGEFVQVAPNVLGPLYATAPEDYSVEGQTIMAVIAAAMPTFRALPFKRFRELFILPPSWEVWQQRIKAHGFVPEQQMKRLQEAITSLEYAVSTPEVCFVLNDTLAEAVAECERILQGSKPAMDRLEGQKRAKTLLENLKLQQSPL